MTKEIFFTTRASAHFSHTDTRHFTQTTMGKIDFIFLLSYCVLWFFAADAADSFTSTYPYMSDFLTDKIDPKGNCPHFVCNESALKGVQIDTLVGEENKKRNDYAVAKQISGIYRVYWSDALAKFARKKAQLCLPPTFHENEEKYHIFDSGETIKKIFHPRSPVLLRPASIQIVAGMRTENLSNPHVSPIMFKAKLIDYYVTLFNSKTEHFELRGSTTLMGCGYIIQRTESTLTDRLLCVYGMLYGGDEDYVLQKGQPCSKCDYYQYEDKYADPRILARDRLERWNCDYTYTSLCSDLNKKPILEYKPSEFNCKDPHFGLADTYVSEKIEEIHSTAAPVDSVNTVEHVPIPCWYILAPMSTIIICLIGACCYHIVTSVLTYKKIRQKTVSK